MSLGRWYGARVRFCLVALLLAFGGLVARAVLLQERDGERLARLAVRQSSRDIEVAPRRGPIYDREGTLLALSVEVESVYARPSRVPAGAIPSLAAALDLTAAEVRARLDRRRPFVWVRRQVPRATAARVRALELPGVGFVTEHKRFYPNGPLAGHLLGFVGLDGQGLEGIEMAFDAALRGDVAHRAEERDARGRGLLPDGLDPDAVAPEGAALVLTLDRRIQFATERALRQAVETTGAAGAAAVVLDPATGELLAMADVPDFDPNRFAQARPAAWRNRAVTDAFEPGSTIKVFLAAAALDGAVVGPDERFFTEHGAYRRGGLTVHDVHPSGWLTLPEILRVSSNIGAVKVAERIGAERYRRTLVAFGFGRRTGVELPGEAEGALQPAGGWSPVSLAAVAYGYGLTATPIQLAAALAAIANNGVAVAPRIVRGTLLADGTLVPFDREAKGGATGVRRVIAPETARRLTSMLQSAVTPGGTGQQAALAGYGVAGKTGTARKVEEGSGYAPDRYLSSFVGFVPAEAPRFVIAVFIDEPKGSIYGGVVAAPPFRAIAEAALAAYRVPPTVPVAPAPARPGAVVLASHVPDLTHFGMREVFEFARRRGLKVEVEGSGRAVSQRPTPGAPWPPDAHLWVKFAP